MIWCDLVWLKVKFKVKFIPIKNICVNIQSFEYLETNPEHWVTIPCQSGTSAASSSCRHDCFSAGSLFPQLWMSYRHRLLSEWIHADWSFTVDSPSVSFWTSTWMVTRSVLLHWLTELMISWSVVWSAHRGTACIRTWQICVLHANQVWYEVSYL